MLINFFCGNHFVIYVSQTILYALILYNDVCQLYMREIAQKLYWKQKKVATRNLRC